MRNVLNLITFLICFFAIQFDYSTLQSDSKGGCLDENAINFCLDCDIQEGECFYDNEPSYRCEDPSIKWKRRWNPRAEWDDDFVIFTYSRCWEEWEVTIYDYWGKEIWLSFNPSDKWSGLTSKNDYVEAGTYLMSIKAKTRGMTKQTDILTEVEIFYDPPN